MKKIIFTLTIILAAGSAHAQRLNMGLQAGHATQRREAISKMTPEQRRETLKKVRESLLLEDLKIPEGREEEFQNIYRDYQAAQKKITETFKNDFDPEKLSDEEAQEKLETSFEAAQKLLDNRQEYARKMGQVVKPQEILKMFRSEGMIREKIIDRKMNAEYRNGVESQDKPVRRLEP